MSALHTQDAAAALQRMLDLGLRPFLVSRAVGLVISQRLVRHLCPHCRKRATPRADLLEKAAPIARRGGLDWDGIEKDFHEPIGCAKCGGTGYLGRTLIAEMLDITPEIVAALEQRLPASDIRAVAVRGGMTTLAADGMRKAAQRQTSLEEAFLYLPDLDG